MARSRGPTGGGLSRCCRRCCGMVMRGEGMMRPLDYRRAADGAQIGFARPAHWQRMASLEILRVGFLLAGLLHAFDALADTTNCTSDKGTVAYAQCVNSMLTELQKQLDQTYRQALGNIPKLSFS